MSSPNMQLLSIRRDEQRACATSLPRPPFHSMTTRRFDVQLAREAEKDLRRLRPHTEFVTRAIFSIGEGHTFGYILSGSLNGARSLEFSFPGSGEYRAVSTVQDGNRVCLIEL